MDINNMTKDQMMLELKAYKKITHRYFSPEEWMRMTKDGKIELEDGVICKPFMFWFDRSGPAWDDGWSIYKEK